MKKLMIFATTAMIVSNLAHAAGEQSDAREAHESTVKTSTVKYSCQNGKKLSVKYGFNEQGIPTYAEAKLSGKKRFMPINLYTTDATGTNFGDENNFSLYGDPMEFTNHRKASVNIQSPASEILYKGCTPQK
ncbi:adhesin [Mannheimia haemolytica]|uniref:ACP-like domain-containing protein n=1 Tax=Mannheimia haemolytica TaxID=75985 RepID=UPI002EC99124|nr:adhesin [Mannheimia haemolytica]